MCRVSLASVRVRLLCQEFGTGRYGRGLRYDFLCPEHHYTSDRHQGNTLQCIETFRGLERLTVQCSLDDPPSDAGIRARSVSSARTRTLRSVLGSVHSGGTLLSLDVEVWLLSRDSYWVDRTGLLDLLLGDEMLAILSRFTELRQLYFTLWESDREHDAGWWTAEMVRRLPDSCHAAVSVKMRVWTSGASCGPV